MSGQKTVASVSHTVETDLVVVLDPKMLQMSQLSIYLKSTLGSATKVSFGYYFSFDLGVTWYKVPRKDNATNFGDLVDSPSYIDANSPLISTGIYGAVDNLPTSGANAFKVTGLAAGSDSGSTEVTVMNRDN